MNAHVFTCHEITTGRRKPSEIVAEYDVRSEALARAFATFTRAGDDLKNAATIGGTWGNVTLCTGRVHEALLADSLLKSAWRHVFQRYGLADIARAADKKRFETLFERPPAFTVDSIRDVFAIWSAIRGVQSCADWPRSSPVWKPAFKSHEKMKIGVKGLPERTVRC